MWLFIFVYVYPGQLKVCVLMVLGMFMYVGALDRSDEPPTCLCVWWCNVVFHISV